MSRGKNNANLVSTSSHNNNNSNGANGGQQQSPALQTGAMAARRGNKTLAWYISDKILDKGDQQEARDTASPLSITVRPSQSQFNRKSSVDSESSLNSNKQNDGNPTSQAKRDRRVRPRSSRRNDRDFFAINSNNAGGKENNCDEDEQRRPDSNGQEGAQGGKMVNVPTNNFVNKERKEDYWYFDPVSDGFYYEFNGSRGWRKRNPKLHGPNGVSLTGSNTANVPPPKGIVETQEQQKPLAAGPPNQQHLTSKFFPTATAVNVPNIKYYDAASDGFFYEMASVDGWRRRQHPTGRQVVGSSGVSHSPPNHPNSLSSHQSAQGQLQQQQQQRIFRPLQQQHPMGRPSSQQQLLFGGNQQVVHRDGISNSPLHFQHRRANQFGGPSSQLVNGPPPMRQNFTNAELEDMIVHSQSVPGLPGMGRMNSSSGQQPAPSMMRDGTTSNPLNFASAVSSGQKIASGVKEDCCNHSSSSTTISSSLSDDHCSPPPNQQEGRGVQSSVWQHQTKPTYTTNGGLSSRTASNQTRGVDIGAGKTTLQQPIGSFEEPYEFYGDWSDNDKNSMSSTLDKASSVSSAMSSDEIMPNQVKSHPSALAAYFNNFSLQQEYNEQLQQQLSKQMNGKSSIQLKRPNSLRLSCTPNNAKAQPQQPQQQHQLGPQKDAVNPYMPHCFNVDKFIADLPLPDHDKILHSLSALRTPMVDTKDLRFGNFELAGQDSPLFTPIFMKDESNLGYGWTASNKFLNGATCAATNGNLSRAAPTQNGGGNAIGSNTNGNGLGPSNLDLNEIERIWKCPAF